MLFNSYHFLCIFLPLALLGYYGAAHWSGPRAAKIFLCVSSFVFYGWWNPALVLLLAGSIAFNFTLSLFMVSADGAPSRRQAWLLTTGVAANLLLLFYYKYLFPLLGFFHSLGLSHFDYGSVVLPIGISFFTFTQIGYLVDCQQGLVKDRGFLNYVLFVTFFPHLIAGPILHHREIMPQFAADETYRFRRENFDVGLTLFVLGLAKKVMFADLIAPWAETGFANLSGAPFIQAWSVALAYSMQLYFDFSGYSDMAIGLGIMFAIRLPLNFNSPYQSLSIIDFWQRWHMTLTRYLTLLLYNPIALWVARYRQRAGLTTSRQAAATPSGFVSMIAFPTFVTMFLAGIWHGAGLQFIVFGLLHALYLTVNHAWRLFHKPLAPAMPKSPAQLLSMTWRVVLTYLCVLLAQIFFRADGVTQAWSLICGMTGVRGSGLPLTIPRDTMHDLGPLQDWLITHHVLVMGLREAYDRATLPLLQNIAVVIGLMGVAFGAPNVYQLLAQGSPALNKVKPMRWQVIAWRPNWVTAVGVGGMLFASTQFFDRTARFLYFQF